MNIREQYANVSHLFKTKNLEFFENNFFPFLRWQGIPEIGFNSSFKNWNFIQVAIKQSTSNVECSWYQSSNHKSTTTGRPGEVESWKISMIDCKIGHGRPKNVLATAWQELGFNVRNGPFSERLSLECPSRSDTVVVTTVSLLFVPLFQTFFYEKKTRLSGMLSNWPWWLCTRLA